MPTLPTYDNQVSLDVPRYPRMDVQGAGSFARDAGRQAVQAMESVKEGLQAISQADAHVRQLKQAQDWATLEVETQKQLLDLRDEIIRSPEFALDPESAEKKFSESAAKVREELIKNTTDPLLSQRLQPMFDMHALRASQDIRHQSWKQRDSLAQGALMGNMETIINNTLRNTSANAFNEGMAAWQRITSDRVATLGITAEQKAHLDEQVRHRLSDAIIKRDLMPDGGGTAVLQGLKDGAYAFPEEKKISYEELAKHKEQADLTRMTAEQERAKKAQKEAAYNSAFDNTLRIFQDDPKQPWKRYDDAVSLLENPEFRMDTLDRDDRIKLSNHYRTLGNAKRIEQETLNKKSDDALEKEIVAGNVDPLLVKNQFNDPKRAEWAETYAHTRATRKVEGDPEVYKKAQRMIGTGEITRKDELRPLLNQGLDPGKLKELDGFVDEMQDVTKQVLFKWAVDRFKAKYAGDAEKGNRRAEFEEVLADQIRKGKDGRPLTGGEITQAADNLLKDIEDLPDDVAAKLERGFLGGYKNRPETQWEVEAVRKPWMTDLEMQPERKTSLTFGGTGKIPIIPEDARAQIVEQMKARGVLVNDQTVAEVWRRLQAAGK